MIRVRTTKYYKPFFGRKQNDFVLFSAKNPSTLDVIDYMFIDFKLFKEYVLEELKLTLQKGIIYKGSTAIAVFEDTSKVKYVKPNRPAFKPQHRNGHFKNNR